MGVSHKKDYAGNYSIQICTERLLAALPSFYFYDNLFFIYHVECRYRLFLDFAIHHDLQGMTLILEYSIIASNTSSQWSIASPFSYYEGDESTARWRDAPGTPWGGPTCKCLFYRVRVCCVLGEWGCCRLDAPWALSFRIFIEASLPRHIRGGWWSAPPPALLPSTGSKMAMKVSNF